MALTATATWPNSSFDRTASGVSNSPAPIRWTAPCSSISGALVLWLIMSAAGIASMAAYGRPRSQKGAEFVGDEIVFHYRLPDTGQLLFARAIYFTGMPSDGGIFLGIDGDRKPFRSLFLFDT